MNTDYIPTNGTPTSDLAAESMRPTVQSIRAEVLDTIHQGKSWGQTCDEIETMIDLPHQTVSARIWELRKAGLVVDSGRRRTTRSGRGAIVWVTA